MRKYSTEFFVGMDLGDASDHICILDPEGEVVESTEVSNTIDEVNGFFDRFLDPGRSSRFFLSSSAMMLSRQPGVGRMQRRCLVKEGKDASIFCCSLTLMPKTICASFLVNSPHMAGMRNAIRLASLTSAHPCCFETAKRDSMLSELIGIPVCSRPRLCATVICSFIQLIKSVRTLERGGIASSNFRHCL